MVFRRPHLNLGYIPDKPEGVNGLPELIEFNAVHNPDSIFCLQARAKGAPPYQITFVKLQTAVERCCAWLLASGSTNNRNEGEKSPDPVGILLGSDITIFIYMAALLRLGTPVSTEKTIIAIAKLSFETQVLCLSARLTSIAIAHLLKATSASTVLVNSQVSRLSKETSELITESSSDKKPSFIEALGCEDFLDNEHPAHVGLQVPPAYVHKERHELGAVIMHSSGTTGLPKPIYHSPSYFLVYAACHRMPEQNEPFGYNVSTVPLYHVSCYKTYTCFRFKATDSYSRIRDLVSSPRLWRFPSACLVYYYQHPSFQLHVQLCPYSPLPKRVS
jgi:acyl-CoA synthetase (AMP-forming)/AMP-acid ligase II